MEFRINFREEAQQDLINAYYWYEDRKIGLGKDFISEVQVAIKYLSQSPEAFPKKKKKFRELILKTFPYIIIYVIEGNLVTVLAVFNTHLNPDKKPSA